MARINVQFNSKFLYLIFLCVAAQKDTFDSYKPLSAALKSDECNTSNLLIFGRHGLLVKLNHPNVSLETLMDQTRGKYCWFWLTDISFHLFHNFEGKKVFKKPDLANSFIFSHQGLFSFNSTVAILARGRGRNEYRKINNFNKIYLSTLCHWITLFCCLWDRLLVTPMTGDPTIPQ